MKKLLLLGMFGIVYCNKPDVQEVNTDCKCDRVVESATFNIVGTSQNPALTYHTVYTTINDCTHIQRSKTHDTTNFSLIPKKGQCR